jgi:5-methylcytosine-specific restriction protein A
MTRSTPEWIGKTHDTPIPARVRVRVFDRYHGICYKSRIKISASDQWDCDHIIALCNGGEHRESNLAPVLKEAHKQKTKDDLAIKKKIASVKKKHLGLKKSSNPMPGSKASRWKKCMDGTVEERA